MARPFGVLDGILLGLGAAGAAGLALVRLLVVPSFLAMFADFGGDLPWSTRVVASSGYWWIVATSCIALLAGGVAVKLGRRDLTGTALLAAAPLLAAAAIGFCFLALYAPIFELAGKVGAD